jgi:hypothetical protein
LNGKQLLVKSLAYAFVKRISLLIPKQAIARSKSFYFKANANAIFMNITQTSAFYKKGKNQFVKIFNYDNKLRAVAEIFIKLK